MAMRSTYPSRSKSPMLTMSRKPFQPVPSWGPWLRPEAEPRNSNRLPVARSRAARSTYPSRLKSPVPVSSSSEFHPVAICTTVPTSPLPRPGTGVQQQVTRGPDPCDHVLIAVPGEVTVTDDRVHTAPARSRRHRPGQGAVARVQVQRAVGRLPAHEVGPAVHREVADGRGGYRPEVQVVVVDIDRPAAPLL